MKHPIWILAIAISALVGAGLSACATRPTEEACLDTGVTYELSKNLMTPQDSAKAVAAAHMVMAELGYAQSDEVANQYNPINPTPAISYVRVKGEHMFVLQDKTAVPSGPTQIEFYIVGSCGPAMEHERKEYLASIKDKIRAALQPYAAEEISSRDAEFIEVD